MFLRFVCRCAREAESRGFSHFGLQFYGECWSGPQTDRNYTMYGASKHRCVSGDPPMDKCEDNSESKCVGKANANYVYEIVSGKTLSRPAA